MARVFLGVGHGGNDPGASGNGLREKDLNLKQALFVKKHLERHGVTVGISRTTDENDDLAEEVRECNAFGADLAVDLHTNAGGGNGWESFYSITESTSGRGYNAARNIEAEVKAIGQQSRGCKTKRGSDGRDYFGFIRNTNCPAIISEMAFIDNWDDIKDFDTDAEIERYAIAVTKGILRTFGIAYKDPAAPTPPPSSSGTIYRVVIGAYSVKANADKAVADAKAKGFAGAYILPA